MAGTPKLMSVGIKIYGFRYKFTGIIQQHMDKSWICKHDMTKHYTTARAEPCTMKFQSSHAIIYGLKIMETDEHTKLIKSVSCRFCSIFGCEVEPMPGVK